MIRKFEEWKINEAKKPAKFKVGDLVRMKSADSTGRQLDYGSDQIWNSMGGVLLKIEKMEEKSNDWICFCELQDGCYFAYPRRGKGYTSNFHKVKVSEKNLTDENVDKFIEIKKDAKYNVKDEVTISAGTEIDTFRKEGKTKTSKTITGKIYAIAVDKSIETGEPRYIVLKPGSYNNVVEGFFTEGDFGEPEKFTHEMIRIIADEIAKKLNIDLVEPEKSSMEAKFDTKYLQTKSGDTMSLFSHDGRLYFPSSENRKKFLSELNTLVKKYCTPDLIKASTNSRYKIPTVSSGEKFYDSVWDNMEIRWDRIVDTAADLNISIQSIVDKNKEKILKLVDEKKIPWSEIKKYLSKEEYEKGSGHRALGNLGM